MSAEKHPPHAGGAITRRQAMRAGAVAGGAAVVGPPAFQGFGVAAAQTTSSAFTSVGAGFASPGLAAGSKSLDLLDSATDWTSGEAPDNDGETDAEYIAQEAFHDFKRFHNSATREMGLHATIIEFVIYGYCGVFHEAKMAAIDEINNESDKATVEQAAMDAAEKMVAKVQESLINCSNAAIQTMKSYFEAVQTSADMDEGDVFTSGYSPGHPEITTWNTMQVTLADGRQIDYLSYSTTSNNTDAWEITDGTTVAGINVDNNVDYHFGDTGFSGVNGSGAAASVAAKHPDSGDAATILPLQDLSGDMTADEITEDHAERDTIQATWDELLNQWSNLQGDITAFVDNAYREVAVGSMNPGDIFTGCDLSQTLAEENPNQLATGALRAQGIDMDLDHEVTIETTTLEGRTVTASGALAATDSAASVSQGGSVDPSAVQWDWILNYSTNDVQIEADDLLHQDTTDGGVILWSDSPLADDIEVWTGDDYIVHLQTGNGETVELPPSDFVDVDGENWSYKTDISGMVNDSITTIESVTVYSSRETTANRYLQRQFTVTEMQGTDSLSYDTDRQIHTTDNYYTPEEWERREQDLEDVRDSLPDENDSGGIFSGGLFGEGGLLDFGGNLKKWAIIGGGGLLLYAFISGD